MKVLEEYKDLEGKKIVFSHMAQFAQQITLATECGCILMAKMIPQDEWTEETETFILHEIKVIHIIESDKFLREELGKLGIFDLKEYKKKVAEQEKERQRQWNIEREEREKREYERLKAKFEGTE